MRSNRSRSKTISLKQQQESYDLGYLLGVSKSDGSFHTIKHKDGSRVLHTFKLSASDLDFVLYFREVLERWTNERFSLKYENPKHVDYTVFRIQYSSRAACEFLKNYPIELIQSKEARIGFIKGFFDSDGMVLVRRKNKIRPPYARCEISNTDLSLLKLMQKWLEEIDFPVIVFMGNKRTKGGLTEYRLGINGNLKVRRFVKEMGGITIGRKAERVQYVMEGKV